MIKRCNICAKKLNEENKCTNEKCPKLETYVGGGVAFVGVLLQHFIGQWNNQIEI